jgi:hypothetical protein
MEFYGIGVSHVVQQMQIIGSGSGSGSSSNLEIHLPQIMMIYLLNRMNMMPSMRLVISILLHLWQMPLLYLKGMQNLSTIFVHQQPTSQWSIAHIAMRNGSAFKSQTTSANHASLKVICSHH